MSLTAKASITAPDETLMTIEMTLTCGEWRRLIEQLKVSGAYPAWRVAEAITGAYNRLHQSHTATVEYEA